MDGAENGPDAQEVRSHAAGLADRAEQRLDEIAATATRAIWEQVPAYAASTDPRLVDDVAAHVRQIARLYLDGLRLGQPPDREAFALTLAMAARREEQGVSLADFLQAFRIGQLSLWESLQQEVERDPADQRAAMASVGLLMRVIEAGSVAAGQAYLEAQQYRLADRDRLTRDLLEDLIRGREPAVAQRQAMLRTAGLADGRRFVVVSGRLLDGSEDGLAAARSALRRTGDTGLLSVRHGELVGLFPLGSAAERGVLQQLTAARTLLEGSGVRLAVGVSTGHEALREVADAYREASAARRGLGDRAGVLAMSTLSVLDYLVLREDPTAQRLIRPEIRRFVTEDLTAGGGNLDTLRAYVAADLNAKAAAERLGLHVNTTYYRLERIGERTGCDLRSFADVAELMVQVRLLTGG